MSDLSIEKFYYTRHENEVVEHTNFDMDLKEIYEKVFSLPIYPDLNYKNIKYVVKHITKYLVN